MRVGLLAAWLGALLLPQVYLLGLRRRLPTLTHLWLLMPAAATAATSTSAAAGPPTQWTCCSGSMRREEQSLLCTSVTSHMPMGARRCAVLHQAAAPCCAAPGAPSRRCVSRAACSSALPDPRHLLTCRPPARASCLSPCLPCLPCLPCRNCRSGMHSWNLWSPLQHTSPIWWGQATTVSWLDGWPLDWLLGWLAGWCWLAGAGWARHASIQTACLALPPLQSMIMSAAGAGPATTAAALTVTAAAAPATGRSRRTPRGKMAPTSLTGATSVGGVFSACLPAWPPAWRACLLFPVLRVPPSVQLIAPLLCPSEAVADLRLTSPRLPSAHPTLPCAAAGNDSGGECGVQISKRFVMPDVSDFGYWTARSARNASANGAAAPAAAAVAAAGSNPTLGPDAAAFLRRVAAGGAAEQQPQQQSRQAEDGSTLSSSSSSSEGSGRAAQPNPPFWYSFSHGSVHFVVLSSEHNLAPGSKQYRVSWLLELQPLGLRYTGRHLLPCPPRSPLHAHSQRTTSLLSAQRHQRPCWHACPLPHWCFQWLEQDLQLVDRCLTPWVVVNMHRPM